MDFIPHPHPFPLGSLEKQFSKRPLQAEDSFTDWHSTASQWLTGFKWFCTEAFKTPALTSSVYSFFSGTPAVTWDKKRQKWRQKPIKMLILILVAFNSSQVGWISSSFVENASEWALLDCSVCFCRGWRTAFLPPYLLPAGWHPPPMPCTSPPSRCRTPTSVTCPSTGFHGSQIHPRGHGNGSKGRLDRANAFYLSVPGRLGPLKSPNTWVDWTRVTGLETSNLPMCLPIWGLGFLIL